jgi:hypothetical protein
MIRDSMLACSRVVLAAAVCLAAFAGITRVAAQNGREPFFKPDDVVALTGGEEMVTMGEVPDLEVLVLRQPGLATVKFRNLACEGDTVFEQFRQLNFPAWPEQLKKVGATVVVAQFGKMESLDGTEAIPRFVEAYERLLDVFAADGRRVVLVSPSAFGRPSVASRLPWKDAPDLSSRNESLAAYDSAIRELARRRGLRFVGWFSESRTHANWRDGIHPGSGGFHAMAGVFGRELGLARPSGLAPQLNALVVEKNRLWSNYWRPQNWAFLHGDRTEQLFSRDHRDTNVRRFLIEIEEYVPLIARQEEEIARLAAESARP